MKLASAQKSLELLHSFERATALERPARCNQCATRDKAEVWNPIFWVEKLFAFDEEKKKKERTSKWTRSQTPV